MDYLQDFNDNIDKVTTEQVRASFAARIDTDKLIIISVGPVDIEPDS